MEGVEWPVEGSQQVLSRAGGGIWGFQGHSSLLPPLQHCAKTWTKHSGKANQLLLVPGTFSHSMGTAVSCSSPAQRNGMCWKIWSTQETCKIKTSNHRKLSVPIQTKNKEKKKNQSSPIQKCHFRNSICHVWWNSHTHCFICEKSWIKIKDNPGIGLKIHFSGQKVFVETTYLKLWVKKKVQDHHSFPWKGHTGGKLLGQAWAVQETQKRWQRTWNNRNFLAEKGEQPLCTLHPK